MHIYLSNQGHLRNFRTFVESVDLASPDNLTISTHDKWVTVHPATLVLTAALAMQVGSKSAKIVGHVPETGRYLDRMGLYALTSTPSPFRYHKKEEAGRFVPIQVIRTPSDQSRFLTDMIPLLHLSESSSLVVKYVLGELVRNVFEHANARLGAVVAAQYFKKTG